MIRDTPELCALRSRLRLWGRICCAIGIGYAPMSSHEKARIGRGGVFDGAHIPDFLADIDACVSRAPHEHKRIIVETYTKSGTYRDHAARLALSVDAFYRHRNKAEVYLNTQLTAQMKV